MKKAPFYYSQGIYWFLLSLVVSCGNDMITKYLRMDMPSLHSLQITFLRTFFGLVGLSAYLCYAQPKLKTNYLKVHILRGAIFSVASGLWTYGLGNENITMATLISFTIPIFVLMISAIWLREKVSMQLALATFIGFLGIAVTLSPQYSARGVYWNSYVACFVGAAILFACLDVMHKYYIHQDSMLRNMLYMMLATLGFTAPFAYAYWQWLSLRQWALFFLLGLGGDLIVYCFLKAYKMTTLVSLAPLRYVELFFSMLGSIYCFQEQLPYRLWGGLLIVPAVLSIIHNQRIQRVNGKLQAKNIKKPKEDQPNLRNVQ